MPQLTVVHLRSGWSPVAHSSRTVTYEGFSSWQTLSCSSFIIVLLPSSELLLGWEDLSLSFPVPFRPLCERRKFLHDNMVEIPNRIMFSEMKQVTVSEDPTLDRIMWLKSRTQNLLCNKLGLPLHLLSVSRYPGGQGMEVLPR